MAEALATITEIAAPGMIQIRADLERAGDAIAEAAGLAIPGQTRFSAAGDRWLGWMSPDELLLILPRAEVAEALAALTDALTGEHALVLDVSDMRTGFDVIGEGADEALAKLAPVDFAQLAGDGVRRTRLAQVSCAMWPVSGGYRVVGFRSVADYMRGLLQGAARPGTTLAPR